MNSWFPKQEDSQQQKRVKEDTDYLSQLIL